MNTSLDAVGALDRYQCPLTLLELGTDGIWYRKFHEANTGEGRKGTEDHWKKVQYFMKSCLDDRLCSASMLHHQLVDVTEHPMDRSAWVDCRISWRWGMLGIARGLVTWNHCWCVRWVMLRVVTSILYLNLFKFVKILVHCHILQGSLLR